MNIYSWNVNGIRSAIKKGFGDWFNAQKPDILCLQETRADEDQVPEDIRNPEGYFAYWNPCKRKKGYSGVAVFSQIEPDTVNYGFDIEEFDEEGRVLQLVFPDWVLNSIYFPNGGSGDDRLDYKLRFYDAFLENSRRWLANGKHVVTLGDYNTCHKNNTCYYRYLTHRFHILILLTDKHRLDSEEHLLSKPDYSLNRIITSEEQKD